MSELTRCNYCTLRDMKRRAKKAHRNVFTVREIDGMWKGWTMVYYSDKTTEPATRFMELTDHCVC